ncbi:MAG: alpha/beta fold hydrolase [Victivallales bacterium]|nr:alpha/beta fold hydrolase [Victivallales bacterium]
MWKQQYNFDSRWFRTPFNQRMHYLDVGQGFPVVMLHGNPTWSFMYRGLIHATQKEHIRAIAPDYIGCGYSDKPQDWDYRLAKHVSNLEALIDDELKLPQFDLVVHDWGAPIGFLYAVRRPERIRKIVIMNSVVWMTSHFPRAVHLTRLPVIGSLLVRSWNLLLKKALKTCTVKPLSQDAIDGFKAPYDTFESRIAIQRFPQDIPTKPSHPSYNDFLFIKDRLSLLREKPMLICWGEKDFCFPDRFLKRWRHFFPNAIVKPYSNASHFLLEEDVDVIPTIVDFLKENDGNHAAPPSFHQP